MDNFMEKIKMTEKKAVKEGILDKNSLHEFSEWFSYITDKAWDYVVFASNESYALSLIMEQIKGKCLDESKNTVFLTQNSFILQCGSIARKWDSSGRFPSILICDTIIMHGKSINHLMDAFLRNIMAFLPDKKLEDAEREIYQSVTFSVCAKADTGILLYGKNESRLLHCSKVCGQKEVLDTAYRISELVMHSGFRYSPYMPCVVISEKRMEELKDKTEIKEKLIATNYLGHEQMMFLYASGHIRDIKGLFMLRFSKICGQDAWCAVPSVFLPNIDMDTTKKLLDYFGFLKENELKKFCETSNMQTVSEMIAFCIGNIILCQLLGDDYSESFYFEKDADNGMSAKNELQKIARNFNKDSLDETKGILKKITEIPVPEIDEMAEFIKSVIPRQFHVVFPQKRCIGGSGSASEKSKDNRCTADEIKECALKFEQYLSEKILNEEKESMRISNNCCYIGFRVAERKTRGLGFSLDDIAKDYTIGETFIGTAILMQMEDMGMISISHYPPNHMYAEGYMQFLSCRILSMFIQPMKIAAFIPMLASMQKECRRWNISLYSEWTRFSRKFWDEIKKNLTDEEISRFLKRAEESGEDISWYEYAAYRSRDSDLVYKYKNLYEDRWLKNL